MEHDKNIALSGNIFAEKMQARGLRYANDTHAATVPTAIYLVDEGKARKPFNYWRKIRARTDEQQ
jgi:hypothetical protein